MKRRTDHEPPAHWQDFEDLCLKLWRPRLIDAKKNGRTGQPQAGVDIFGRDPKTDEWVGIQCKQRGRWPKKDLTTGEIKAEVEQAESFEPALLHFIVATTAPRDAEVQKFIREFSDGRRAEGKFTVDLFAWDDLQDWLQEKQPESIQPRERQPVIPPATRDFSGRADELEKLHRMVGEHGGAMIYGVRGLGGIGKTQLGLKLVETVGDDYPDGHILVELGGASDHPLSTRDAMASVIRAYEPQSRLPEAEEDVRRLYHQTLRNRRAIVLLDDAASPQQVESLLPHTGCLALVTSRWRFALPKLHRLDLDALTPEAARELLFSLAPQLGAQADRLAELLGRLPLALRLAGSAFAEDPFLKPYEYMQMFERREKRLGLMEKVEQAIGFNYQALEPELRQQWRTLAVFPGDFDVAGAAAVWAMEADAARNVLATVYRAGLAEWRSGRCRLHDLARDFAASQLEVVERHKAAAQHAAHYVGVLEEANRLYLKGGGKILEGFALFDAEWRNISVGQAWAATEADNDHETAKLCKMYSSCSAYILSLRLHPRKWIAWLKAGRSAAVSLGDRHGEGSTLTNLGLAYKDLGELEKAIECHKKALLIDREINDRLGESADLGSLGLAYVDLGELKKAIGYHKQHLTIAREIGDRRGEGNAQGNLGSAFCRLGDIERAIGHHEQQLAIAREIGDRRGESNAITGLGSAHRPTEPKKAIGYYEQAVAIHREIGDRRNEGNVLTVNGLAYAALGELEKAIDYYEQALTIHREIGCRRGEGAALGNMGLAYSALGKIKKAVNCYEQSLVIHREIGERRAEGANLSNLGLAYHKLGKEEAAVHYYEEALTVGQAVEDTRIIEIASNHLKRLREV